MRCIWFLLIPYVHQLLAFSNAFPYRDLGIKYMHTNFIKSIQFFRQAHKQNYSGIRKNSPKPINSMPVAVIFMVFLLSSCQSINSKEVVISTNKNHANYRH
jgi:VanZ family protein